MEESNSTKFDILYKRINDRLNEDFVKNTDESISLFELIRILKEYFYTNKTSIDKELLVKKKIFNRERLIHNLTHKTKIPKIFEINLSFKNNLSMFSIIFTDKDRKYKGSSIMAYNGNDLESSFEFLDEKYSKHATLDLLNRVEINNSLYRFNFITKDLQSDYEPNNPNNIQTIDDGFIQCRINLDNLDDTRVCLSNLEDTVLSTVKTNKYGELNDYIVMYNSSLMLRTKVDINSLNPIFQTIVKNALSKEKEMVLKRKAN